MYFLFNFTRLRVSGSTFDDDDNGGGDDECEDDNGNDDSGDGDRVDGGDISDCSGSVDEPLALKLL